MRVLTIVAASLLCLSCAAEPDQAIPKPRPCQLAWQEAELGVLICYELHTFNEGRYNQRLARVTPVADANQFDPANLDTDQWVRTARDAGARFAILTASHESGFRLWQSDVNPFCLKAVQWGEGKRDIVREFVASCRTYGIKPGIYLGTRWNAQLGVYDFKVTQRSTISQAEYNRLIEQEVEEICTQYGPWFEFWFDGGAHGPDQGGPDVLSLVATHQPQAVFYHNLQRADARWGGSESGTVPTPCWATFPYVSTGAGESAGKDIAKNGFALLKHGDPNGPYWMPAMSDAPLRGHGGHEWFWEPGDERLITPLEKLVDMYERSVGHNSTLILGITPNTDGLLPAADVQRLKAFGREIRQAYGHAMARTSGNAHRIELNLDQAAAFDAVVIQEDIQHGELVRQYSLEVRKEGQWQALAEGTCIGHKRIHRVRVQRAEALRLSVNRAVGTPRIKQLAIHHVTGPRRDLSTDPMKVLIIGDSISLGYTPFVTRDLAGEAEVRHNPGNAQATAYGLKHLDAWLGTEAWDVIHFNWGLWDLCYRHPESRVYGNRDKERGTLTTTLAQYRANLETIVLRLRKTDATLIFGAITPVPEAEAGRFPEDAVRYNAVAREVMQTHGVHVNDLFACMADHVTQYQVGKGDVHFTKAGYERLAAEVVRSVRGMRSGRKQ